MPTFSQGPPSAAKGAHASQGRPLVPAPAATRAIPSKNFLGAQRPVRLGLHFGPDCPASGAAPIRMTPGSRVGPIFPAKPTAHHHDDCPPETPTPGCLAWRKLTKPPARDFPCPVAADHHWGDRQPSEVRSA